MIPKRAARFWRAASSLSKSVVGRCAERSGFGAVGSVVVGSLGLVSGAGGSTVRSSVLEGSVSVIWFGTAVGLAGWVRPPAAIAAAEAGSVVAAASSSQSISSSVPVVAVVVVVGGAALEASCSVSYCWRRAISSAFLPVWGRERDLRRSSSSAFFFLV